MDLWFSSDHHFLHQGIIDVCNRPFKDEREMRDSLIDEHNSLVKKNDICHFIGDFSFCRKDNLMKIQKILGKLNGTKILILGNHDEGRPFSYVNMGFQSVHTSLVLPQDPNFILCHDPSASIVVPDKTWIVGHVHTMYVVLKNTINVSVDAHNFKPVNMDEIKWLEQMYCGSSLLELSY